MKRFASFYAAPVAILLFAACGASHTPGDAGSADGGRDGGPVDGGDLAACSVPTDCVVVPASCCGSCGAATRGDAIALNVTRANEYRTSVCDGLGCPACFMEQDPTLIATCQASRCVVVDLYEHAAAACTGDDECRIRTVDCCECGGDITRAGIIAIRRDSEGPFSSLVCDPGWACPECAPTYPSEVVPVCHEGHCRAVWGTPPP